MSWEPYEGGYERTRDRALIETLLTELKEQGFWVQFVAPDFRSGPTVLLDIYKDELIFDLPRPWNPYLEQARVVYRDRSQVVHSFRVVIIKTNTREKTILTTRPKAIYRLERRRFYRIKVPQSSKALFRCGEKQICAEVIDVSGCGMAILLKRGETLPLGAEISDIRLELFLSASKAYEPIFIPKGRVARFQERLRGRHLYGIEFLINEKAPPFHKPLAQRGQTTGEIAQIRRTHLKQLGTLGHSFKNRC